jgi:hypothetical protein
MKNKVLYHHIRLDNGEIFYVGIGDSARPYSHNNRNNYWHNIVEKYGYRVEIIKESLDWGDACKLEILEIKKFGRKDLGLGPLVNLTDGGDGTENLSYESRMVISEKMTGEQNHRYGIYGEDVVGSKLSQNDAENIRSIFIPHSKQFGIRALAKQYNVDRQTIKKIVQGKSYKDVDGNNKEYEDKTIGIGTSGKFSVDDITHIRTVFQPHHPEFGTKGLSKKFNTNSSRIWKIVTYQTHKNVGVVNNSVEKEKLSPKNSKFSPEDIRIIRTLSAKEAVEKYKLPRCTYYRIKNHIYYKNVI